MNAAQLNAWAADKKAGRIKSSFVPQLTTGSMPSSQASAVAPVNVTPADLVAANAIPFVPGGYPAHLADPSNPGVQWQRQHPSAQPAPWVSVPVCAQTGRKIEPAHGVGLTPHGSGNLNFSGTSAAKNAPRKTTLFTAA